ncbi:expressed unknown protein [Seminavis robusta]|uniref:FAS1 domain-containing protein n=1 Tax=Seminavis robusta TaxID=568900 RepID=A0A9N8H3M5_9STRA|nr:expressed unknown protein [Seminavis robusta]|eukprot:Sro64_g036370.1 n/a (196) ;mRNA; f:96756-97611
MRNERKETSTVGATHVKKLRGRDLQDVNCVYINGAPQGPCTNPAPVVVNANEDDSEDAVVFLPSANDSEDELVLPGATTGGVIGVGWNNNDSEENRSSDNGVSVVVLPGNQGASEDGDGVPVAVVLPGNPPGPVQSTFAAPPGGPVLADITEVARGTQSLSSLLALINTAGLVETLKGQGPFTVFAPSMVLFQPV